MPTQTTTTYRIGHSGWEALETTPRMANDEDQRTGLSLTNRSIRRDGEPWIPVTGEIHYSRLPRERWATALRLMKAGGINVVATYVFWIHHQEKEEPAPTFEGNLDLAAFVRLCHETGLEVVLRVGPWCHGEVRNGGHPDWVVNANYAERTNDPEYLDAVSTWFGHIGREVAGLCGDSGPVIGIQLENELYDQPEHIRTLKTLARQSGLFAPLWTATAWGGADIPVGEVFPLYGGYSDGFWVDTDDGWDDSFQAHFHFSHQWDDPGIGKDLAGDSRTGEIGVKHPDFPAATCELGGGMASAYHRRPAPTGRDIAAVGHCKLGSGSTWQGYYMYAGGTNPRGESGLQESHATGYPNDLPVFDYDFGAPVGSHLQLRESFHRLRNQHSFLEAFGSRLGAMSSSIPEASTTGEQAPDDVLRWALRSDGNSGFVYINNHRPFEALTDKQDVQFNIGLDAGQTVLPHRPIAIPSGEFMAWPVNLAVNGVVINWATLNVLTVLEPEGEVPTLVLTANDGVQAHLSVPSGYSVSGHPVSGHPVSGHPTEATGEDKILEDIDTAEGFITIGNDDGGRLRVLVLDAAQALQAWTPTLGGRRHLVLSDAAIIVEDGRLLSITEAVADAAVFPPLGAPGADGFSHHRLPYRTEPPEVSVVQTKEASAPPEPVITVPGRASAPAPDVFARHAARYTIAVKGAARTGERSLLRLELLGDTAAASFEQREEDVFWDGSVWDVDITPAKDTDLRTVEVAVYPLEATTPVKLPDEAERVKASLTEPTAQILSATVITYQRAELVPGSQS